LSMILTNCFYTCITHMMEKILPDLWKFKLTQFQTYSFLTTVFKKKGQKLQQSHYNPDRAWGFQEVQDLRLQDNQHTKVVRLSVLHTGHFYTPGNTPVTHFCHRLSRPRGHSASGRIMSMKNPTTLK
jgi:hypothetical protein